MIRRALLPFAILIAGCGFDAVEPTVEVEPGATTSVTDEVAVPLAEWSGTQLPTTVAQLDPVELRSRVTVEAIGRGDAFSPVESPSEAAVEPGNALWRVSGSPSLDLPTEVEQLRWTRGTLEEIWRVDEIGLQHEIVIGERPAGQSGAVRIALELPSDAHSIDVVPRRNVRTLDLGTRHLDVPRATVLRRRRIAVVLSTRRGRRRGLD